MKIAKFMKLAKKRSHVTVIQPDGDYTVFLSTGVSIYPAGDLPHMEGIAQIAAVLDIDSKMQEKIFIDERYYSSIKDVDGLDLSDEKSEGEVDAERIKVSATIEGELYAAIRCDDGELIFFDDALLAPVVDKAGDEYLKYSTRQTAFGRRYIIVRDGFTVIAAIMPTELLTDDYINDLHDFLILCSNQLDREKEQEKKKAARDGKQMELETGTEEKTA